MYSYIFVPYIFVDMTWIDLKDENQNVLAIDAGTDLMNFKSWLYVDFV